MKYKIPITWTLLDNKFLTIKNSGAGIDGGFEAFGGDALGIDAVGEGVDFLVGKLEGLQTRLRGYADEVRGARDETEGLGGDFGGAGALSLD